MNGKVFPTISSWALQFTKDTSKNMKQPLWCIASWIRRSSTRKPPTCCRGRRNLSSNSYASSREPSRKYIQELLSSKMVGVSKQQTEVNVVKTGILGVKSIPVESIPGLEETGYKPATRVTRGQLLEESQDIDTLANMLKTVLNAVRLKLCCLAKVFA